MRAKFGFWGSLIILVGMSGGWSSIYSEGHWSGPRYWLIQFFYGLTQPFIPQGEREGKMEIDIKKYVDEIVEKEKRLRKEIEDTPATPCPFAPGLPKMMGNGVCVWCGEDHWTGHK